MKLLFKKLTTILLILTFLYAPDEIISSEYRRNPPPTRHRNQKCYKNYYKTKGGNGFTKFRGLYLLPNNSSDSISSIPNSGMKFHPSWSGELDISVMFTKNLGFSMIFSSYYNSLWGKKSLEKTKIGTAWLIPPIACLQWRIFPSSLLQPYIGGGGNYTLFHDPHSSLQGTHLKLKHSWGPVAQAGFDFFIWKNWIFNVEAKYVWIKTTAALRGDVSGRCHVRMNPWLFSSGFGVKW